MYKFIYFLFIFLLPYSNSHANDLEKQPITATIKVQSKATILAEVDYIKINLYLKKQANTLNQAKHAVDLAGKQLFAIFQRFHIKKADQDAGHIQSQSIYRWNKQRNMNEEKAQEISRYISIKLRKTNQLAAITHALIQVKNVHIQNQEYGFNNPLVLQNKALQKALKQAQKKAQLMLKSLNQHLGAPLQVKEIHEQTPTFRAYAASVRNINQDIHAEPAPMPVAKRKINAQVEVIFKIKP